MNEKTLNDFKQMVENTDNDWAFLFGFLQHHYIQNDSDREAFDLLFKSIQKAVYKDIKIQ